MKPYLFSLKRVWPSYGVATPPGLLAHRNCISGLSNEVYNVSVQQLVLEIQAVKVERSKKKLNLLSKTGSFFDRSTLMSRITCKNCRTEKLNTSMESPDIQLLYEPDG